MKVTYFTGMQMFREFVCLEHPGLPGKIARDWWRQRHKSNPPSTINDALAYMSELRMPKRIRVWCNKKWPEIVGTEF
jgi:DNA repair protein RadD